MNEEKRAEIKALIKDKFDITNANEVMLSYVFSSAKLVEKYPNQFNDLGVTSINEHYKIEEIQKIFDELQASKDKLIVACRVLAVSGEVSTKTQLKNGLSSDDWNVSEIVDIEMNGKTFAAYKAYLIEQQNPNE